MPQLLSMSQPCDQVGDDRWEEIRDSSGGV